MSTVIYEAQAAALRSITSSEKVVALILAARMNSKLPGWGGRPVAMPKITDIAKDAELDKRTVSRAIATLKELGIIEIVRFRKSDGYLSRNYYVWTADKSDSYVPNWMATSNTESSNPLERMTAEQEAAAAKEGMHPMEWIQVHPTEVPPQQDAPAEEEEADTLPIAVPTPKKPARKATKKQKLHPVPNGWRPSDKAVARARERYPSMPIEEQIESFINYHESKGSKMVDWEAAWRNWCIKGNKIANGAWEQSPTPGASQATPAINPATGKAVTKEDFWYACKDHGIDPRPYVNFWKPSMGLPGNPGWEEQQARLDRHTGRG